MKEHVSINPIETLEREFSSFEAQFKILGSIFTPFEKSHILFVVSESGRNVVIKIPAKNNNASREWIGLRKAYEAGISVPEPIALVITQEGSQALVSNRVYGEPLFKSPKGQLRNDLGRITSKLHNNVAVSGNEWVKSGKPNFIYYDQSLLEWSRQEGGQLKLGSRTQEIIKKFTTTASIYCKMSIPVFNHNDIHEGQVIVKPEGGIVLLDFENWQEDTKLNDIAYYLFQLIRTNSPLANYEAFLEGYLESNKLKENDKAILSFYLLFISSRALNYFQTHKSKYLNVAEDTHNRILKYVDAERVWKDL